MMDFSLFFFSNYDVDDSDKYHLLKESVKYADQECFKAVWTPERHFHEFGGLFPNPSVTSAALAMITKQIELRSGSTVSPLHDEIRIAEEWSVVDNLSKGRVALSFASGWNGNDFAMAKENYQNRHEVMYKQIDNIQRLWKGEKIKRVNGFNKEVEVGTFPRPIQKELSVWITAAGNEKTYIMAGEKGMNLLTHLLGQDLDELARKIALYREARETNGHGADLGKVALMLHTYVGDDEDETMKVVEKPFINYLRSATSLSKIIYEEAGHKAEDIPEEDKELMLRHSFLRYSKEAALIGTLDSCSETVVNLSEIGVDEIACLVDFGVEPKLTLEALKNLKTLQQIFSNQEAVV
ncbi:MAG: LLM class flavin-dependent oxidoreductase [Roseivirga sp.]|nr:LLM class flavin-dependent oxidoreductase [Roseivirga sp.]